MPDENLNHTLWRLWRMFENNDGDEDKSKIEIWNEYIEPAIDLLPKDKAKITERSKEYYTYICLSSGDAFPVVFSKLKNYLTHDNNHHSFILSELTKTGLCSTFPKEVLEFLTITINSTFQRHHRNELKKCLDEIILADNSLSNDGKYTDLLRLME